MSKVLRAKRAFEQSSKKPVWLEANLLPLLQQKCPFRSVPCYSLHSRRKRGEERAQLILNLVDEQNGSINNFLELGCGDGMICCALQRRNKKAVGIDLKSDAFEKEHCVKEDILFGMDVSHLKFKEKSFDFVFSFWAFEHFIKPELALQEAIRVVKTGGYIYLDFGPIYTSPWGLHAYRLITFPYCQFLFPNEVLRSFANVKDWEFISSRLNKWTPQDYRTLWSRYSHKIKKCKYNEIYDRSALDLIIEYPSVFKSKISDFDNLLISNMQVLFKKVG